MSTIVRPLWSMPSLTVAVAVAGTLLAAAWNRPLVVWLQSLLDVSGHEPQKEVADVIVVLGYALFRNGTITAPLAGRVQAGVDAWARGVAPNLVFSGAHPGGGLRGHTSEANAMQTYAKTLLSKEQLQQASTQWYLEEASTSTRENAVFSLGMAKEKGWSRVVVVTNTFHQFRSRLVFLKAARELGIDAKVLIARMPFMGHQGWGWGLDPIMDHVDFWRELAAIAYYKYVRKYI